MVTLRFPDDSRSVDLSAALARVGGDEELLREIAQIFLDESPNSLARLRAAAGAGDADAIETAAHTLKGSVGNFGAETARAAAFRVEEIGRSRDLSGVQKALAALETAVHALNAELARLIAS